MFGNGYAGDIEGFDLPPHLVPHAHLSQELNLHPALRLLEFSSTLNDEQLSLGRLIEILASQLELVEDGADRGPDVVAGFVSKNERVEHVSHLDILGDGIEVTGQSHDAVRLAQEVLV